MANGVPNRSRLDAKSNQRVAAEQKLTLYENGYFDIHLGRR
jgi:hypothetical protein